MKKMIFLIGIWVICIAQVSSQYVWTMLPNTSSMSIADIKINKNNQLYVHNYSPCFGERIVKYDTTSWSKDIVGYCDNGSIGKMQEDGKSNLYAIVKYQSSNPNYDAIYRINDVTSNILDTTYNYSPGSLLNFYSSLAVSETGDVYATVSFWNNTMLRNNYQVAKFNYSTLHWNVLKGIGTDSLNVMASCLLYANNTLLAAVNNLTDNHYYVATWNGNSWGELGTGNGALNANNSIKNLYKDNIGNVYATGDFTNASNNTYRAMWNKSKQSWSELLPKDANPFADTCIKVESIIFDNKGNCYGISKCLNKLSQEYVAKWNGTSWQELTGLNVNNVLTALTIDTSGNVYSVSGSLYNNYIVKYSQVVPVNILKFIVQKESNNVVINWQTATEQNIDYYNIQLSTNSKEFATIGTVKAKGEGGYTYSNLLTSDMLGFSKLYYRLEIVNKDGSKQYGEVRQLIVHNEDLSISVSPNPAKDYVTINGSHIKQIKVSDMVGKTVVYKSFTEATNPKLIVTELAKGIYYLSVTNASGHIETIKMIKE